MAPDRPPARYFPIDDAPYRFRPGLHPFGEDFGNGEADRQFFQLDREAPIYRRAKAQAAAHRRSGVLARTEGQLAAHRTILRWIHAQLAREHPDLCGGLAPPSPQSDPGRAYEAIARLVQEDLAVLYREDEEDDERAIAVYVDAPSGWRPERILGATFREIHGPVPGFAEAPAQAAAMVSGMIRRGPYVRFVWTITADDDLDHHPDRAGRRPWRSDGPAWLRVERQTTVPFPRDRASLFLIRTYLYPFEHLTPFERGVLCRALAAMPPEIARYKRLDGEPLGIAQRLLMEYS